MKNKCPYLQSNRDCTHKRKENTKTKKLPICIHSNERKCSYYNDWLIELESAIRMLEIKSELQFKDRMT